MTSPTGRAWRRPAGWAGVALSVLAGCATPVLREESEQHRLKLAELSRGTGELRQDLAGLRADVAGLRAQLTQLGSDLQAAQTGLRQSEDRQREALAAAEARLQGAERRAEEAQATAAATETSVGGLADQVARLEAVSTPTPRTRPSPRGKLAAAELFDRGMDSYRNGELGQAVLDFEEFVAKHPGHPLTASAQFWIAESYFRARDFENAVSEYQKAIDLAPTGDKTPDALLRLGLALRALKREDRARDAWGRLVRDFADSDAAQRARMVLREPARPGRPGAAIEPK